MEKFRNYVLFTSIVVSSGFILIAFMQLMYNVLTIDTYGFWDFVWMLTCQVAKFGIMSLFAVCIYLIGYGIKIDYFSPDYKER